jgi:hypothetical protein
MNITLPNNMSEAEKKRESNKFIYVFEARLESEHLIKEEKLQDTLIDSYYTAFTSYMMKGYKYHIIGDAIGQIQ